MFDVIKICCDRNDSLSESFHFCHVLQTSRDGSVAKPRSILNKAIFDPWQRSLFSRQRTLVHEILAIEMQIERIFEVFSSPVQS